MPTIQGFHTLSTARTLGEVVASVTRWFGSTARLYAVDHAFEQLVSVDGRDGTAEPVALPGQARRALLSARSTSFNGSLWIPLPERLQSVFVVRTEANFDDGEISAPLLGAVLREHRHRLEDLERARRRADMSVAAELQWGLLPQRADSLGGFDVASVLEPAYEVAGDVFDYAMSDEALWVYSFDGMGHGMEATISSVLVLSAVRNVRRQGGALQEQMVAANRALHDRHSGDRFVTGAGCRIGPDGSVSIVNAGHEPIRVTTSSGVERLDLRADLPLGIAGDASYEEQAGPTLGLGDGLTLLSDGSAGSVSVDGESFGADRLDETLESEWSETPLRTGHDVVARVLDFIGDGDVGDDITAVVVRRRTGEEPER